MLFCTPLLSARDHRGSCRAALPTGRSSGGDLRVLAGGLRVCSQRAVVAENSSRGARARACGAGRTGEHAPNGGRRWGPRRPLSHRGDARTFPRLRRRARAGGQPDVGECEGGHQSLATPHCRAVRAAGRSLRRRRRQRRRADSARLPLRSQAVPPLPLEGALRCGRPALSGRPERVVNCDPSAAGRAIRAADAASLRRSCATRRTARGEMGPVTIVCSPVCLRARRQDADARCAPGYPWTALGDAWTRGGLNEFCRRAPMRVGRACVVFLGWRVAC